MRDVRLGMIRGWQVLLWLGPPVVLVSAALAFWSAQRALVATDEEDLSAAAQRIAKTGDLYVARIVTDLAAITASPALRAEAERASARRLSADEDAKLDKDWQSPSDVNDGYEDDIRALLQSELSSYFRSIVLTTDTVTREIMLADREGRLVAASVRTDDYLQDDESWWPADRQQFQACSGPPIQCAQFRDVSWDESAGAFGLDVIMPVVVAGRLVGVVKAVVDPLELGELAQVSDRSVEVTLRKRNGDSLLARAGEGFFTQTEVDNDVNPLSPGAETVVRRPTGDIAVRALAGAMGPYWVATARANAPALPTAKWVLPAVWLALTVVALLVTGGGARMSRDLGRVRAPASEASKEGR